MTDDPATEWGLPDWQDALTYGDTDSWEFMRWRWEFSRRRQDLRDAFDARAKETYEFYVDLYSDPQNAHLYGVGRTLEPHEPGFTAQSYEGDGFGYAGIPNPRISEQPSRVTFSSLDYPGGHVRFNYGWQKSVDGDPCRPVVEEHEVAAMFDLTKPLGEQLAAAKDFLERAQIKMQGQRVQKRRHKSKWLIYLRVLDGRECGATWSEIAHILPNSTARTEQNARDTWEQASALRFNF